MIREVRGPGGHKNAALITAANIFALPQSISMSAGKAYFVAETTGANITDGAEIRVKTPAQQWSLYTGYGQGNFIITDMTAATFPFNIAAGTPSNAFHIDASGNLTLGGDTAAAKFHINGSGLFAESATAYLNNFYLKIVPEFAAEGFHIDYGTTKLLYATEYNAPAYLRVAVGLAVDGVILPQQAATISAPAYVKGGIYFDTTLNKMRIGGATAWETITSV
jgi:hypothetical protein